MKFIKLASLSLIAGVAAFGVDFETKTFGASALAQDAPAVTLDQVLQAVRRERTEVSQENQEREARFLQQRNQQQAELTRVRNQVVAEQATSTRLEAEMEQNSVEIDRLDAELETRRVPRAFRRGAFSGG